MRPTVQHGDHVLAALGLVFHGDGAVAAGGGFPVDAAEFVVGQVFAQALKFGAFAKHGGVAQAHLLQAVAAQQQIVAAHVQQVGVDLDRFGSGRLPWRMDQPSGPASAGSDRRTGNRRAAAGARGTVRLPGFARGGLAVRMRFRFGRRRGLRRAPKRRPGAGCGCARRGGWGCPPPG
jgi:hypothetical protein